MKQRLKDIWTGLRYRLAAGGHYMPVAVRRDLEEAGWRFESRVLVCEPPVGVTELKVSYKDGRSFTMPHMFSPLRDSDPPLHPEYCRARQEAISRYYGRPVPGPG